MISSIRRPLRVASWLGATALGLATLPAFALAPGARPASAAVTPAAAAAAASATSLAGFYQVTDRVYLSTDAAGTNNSLATVQVEKRSAQSKVRKAFLLAASTGFTGYRITDNDVTLNGLPVLFDRTTEIANGISSYNIVADVTGLVKPVVDSAAKGRVDFLLGEGVNTASIDGEILAVVFDDPNEPQTSINLFYGAQNTAGDSFNIRLGTPVDAANPDQRLAFALGISYGYQLPGYGTQFSEIDVNGYRLTSWAGGHDDGEGVNGALITVGGLDDDAANPAVPSGGAGCPSAPRCDDELYDLKAVLADGTTNIAVNTRNQSADDNVFFASLVSRATVAIVNEGILLTPDSQVRQVGQKATVTAYVQDDRGVPVTGRAVSFAVTGVDAGSGGGVTDSGGAVDLKLNCRAAGSDSVVASFVDSRGITRSSNVATVSCQSAAPPPGPSCSNPAECSCDGRAATVVGPANGHALVMGTPGADVIVARGKFNVIVARGGDDLVCGSAGSDVIYGADGADTLHGGGGSDVVVGGAGNDLIDTGSSDDAIDGGSGSDVCAAGGGRNAVINCETRR